MVLQDHRVPLRSCSTIWRSSPAGPSASSRCRPTGSVAPRGAEVDFTLCDQDGEPIEGDEGKITVFTTREPTRSLVSPSLSWLPEYAGLHELVEGTEYEEAVTKIVEDSKHIFCRRACPGHSREARCLHGPLCGKPRQRREGPRGLPIMSLPTTVPVPSWPFPVATSVTLSLPVKYDLPIVPIIPDDDDRAAVEASGETIDTFHAETVDWGLRPRCRGHARPVRQVHRHARRQAPRARLRSWPTSRPWAAAVERSSSVSATGSSAASAIGATPSRPSTASTAASCPCPRISCR